MPGILYPFPRASLWRGGRLSTGTTLSFYSAHLFEFKISITFILNAKDSKPAFLEGKFLTRLSVSYTDGVRILHKIATKSGVCRI
jgi:hypothetical protein